MFDIHVSPVAVDDFWGKSVGINEIVAFVSTIVVLLFDVGTFVVVLTVVDLIVVVLAVITFVVDLIGVMLALGKCCRFDCCRV